MAGHYLRGNKSCASPGQIVLVDTETRPRRIPGLDDHGWHQFHVGCATFLRLEKGQVTRRDELDFHRVGDFWSWLIGHLHQRIPTWIFAHNAGFDLTILEFWRRWEDGEFVLFNPKPRKPSGERVAAKPKREAGALVIEDPPVIVSAWHRSGPKIQIVDTLNYFDCRLADLGKAAGLKKGKLPPSEYGRAAWLKYCRRDVEILEKVMLTYIAWVKEHDLGKFGWTAPSQAMAAYRHRFMEFKPCIHQFSQVRSLERRSLHGGWLELFYQGKVVKCRNKRPRDVDRQLVDQLPRPSGPIYELDMTALYSSILRDRLFPAGLVAPAFRAERVRGWERILDSDCAADVLVETSHHDYPCKSDPTKLELQRRVVRPDGHEEVLLVKGTIYPNGRFRTTLCGDELRRAHQRGEILECTAYCRYQMAELFRDYVDFFWPKRLEYEQSGEPLYAELCKLMLNSLWGKFSQLTPKWRTIDGVTPPAAWGKWLRRDQETGQDLRYRILGHTVQLEEDRDEHPRSSPIISAYTTMWGREAMRRVVSQAGPENVLYVVTDSVFVTQQGLDRLEWADMLADRELGRLRIKSQGATAEFNGLHDWRLGRKRKRGAIRLNAQQVGPGRFLQEHWPSLKSILSREPKGFVRVCKELVAHSPRYDRGEILPNGRIVPLTLTR